MLNVLEHIEDDNSALLHAYRILKPDGVLIIEVPAGPHLYDVYDKLLMHFRRYTLRNLTCLAKKCGFTINKCSHLGFFLYPGFWLIKQKNKRFMTEPETTQRQQIKNSISTTRGNKLFHALMQIELLLGKIISYPFGIRCLLTCKKAQSLETNE
jgi:SAM-dependent methyltransferase